MSGETKKMFYVMS